VAVEGFKLYSVATTMMGGSVRELNDRSASGNA
jgi:hypothetical protein